jgi:crotonobetainyl-CoA:carnitine CoA-transferase CaiB-like acyl-CoA transferase
VHTRTPLLPLRMDGERLPLRNAPPSIGQDTDALLRELGYDSAQIQRMVQDGVVKVVTPLQA